MWLGLYGKKFIPSDGDIDKEYYLNWTGECLYAISRHEVTYITHIKKQLIETFIEEKTWMLCPPEKWAIDKLNNYFKMVLAEGDKDEIRN